MNNQERDELSQIVPSILDEAARELRAWLHDRVFYDLYAPELRKRIEMEKRRSPLLSVPPFGRGFSRHGVFRSDGGWAAQERALTPPFIVSMSPPGYPSAWLRPRSEIPDQGSGQSGEEQVAIAAG